MLGLWFGSTYTINKMHNSFACWRVVAVGTGPNDPFLGSYMRCGSEGPR